MVEVVYDHQYDVLYIFKKDEKVKFSIEVLGNFVIDIGHNNKVVGIEIFDASKILKIPKKELKEIKSAKMSSVI